MPRTVDSRWASAREPLVVAGKPTAIPGFLLRQRQLVNSPPKRINRPQVPTLISDRLGFPSLAKAVSLRTEGNTTNPCCLWCPSLTRAVTLTTGNFAQQSLSCPKSRPKKAPHEKNTAIRLSSAKSSIVDEVANHASHTANSRPAEN